MTVHQAAEHPWIKEEHQELDKRIPASRYNDVRKTIHDKYVSGLLLSIYSKYCHYRYTPYTQEVFIKNNFRYFR